MIPLQAGESILEIERRHWFVLFLEVLRFGLGILAGVVAPFLTAFFAPDFFAQYESFIFLGSILFVQLLWVLLFIIIADYYLDVWIVTNQRIVLIELKGLFHRTLTSVDLNNIQDVSSRLVGIIPMALGYGDVVLQSAGTRGEFIFRQIPSPEAAKERILKAVHQATRL